jgi:hypothetical protein
MAATPAAPSAWPAGASMMLRSALMAAGWRWPAGTAACGCWSGPVAHAWVATRCALQQLLATFAMTCGHHCSNACVCCMFDLLWLAVGSVSVLRAGLVDAQNPIISPNMSCAHCCCRATTVLRCACAGALMLRCWHLEGRMTWSQSTASQTARSAAGSDWLLLFVCVLPHFMPDT